jgi:dihydroneopterin aldolase
VSDRIVLTNMRFDGRHGVHEWEQQQAQPFEVDIELALDLRPAGNSDDLEQTIDYGRVYDIARRIVATESYRLLEALAEAISREVLAAHPADEVTVRIRKPAVRLGGPLDHAAVEIRRRRSDT